MPAHESRWRLRRWCLSGAFMGASLTLHTGVMSREGGASSTPGSWRLSRRAAAYWVARSSRAMTVSVWSLSASSSQAVCALAYAASSIRPPSSLLSAILILKNHALPPASEFTSAGSAASASLTSSTSPEIGA